MRCELGDSSSDVGGVEQGVFGLEVQSLLATEGLGDCSRLLARELKVTADEGGEGKNVVQLEGLGEASGSSDDEE